LRGIFPLLFFSNFRVEFELKELNEFSCEFVAAQKVDFFFDVVGKSPPLERVLWVSFPGSSDATRFHEMQRCWEVIFSSHTWCVSVIHLKTSSNQKNIQSDVNQVRNSSKFNKNQKSSQIIHQKSFETTKII